MSYVIQQNITTYPSAAAIPEATFRRMNVRGININSTDEEIMSAGYAILADPIGPRLTGTIAIADKDQSGNWYMKWMDDNEFKALATTRATAHQMRTKRNSLLMQSDWSQVGDIPTEISTAWKPYRQALRDITAQSGWPMNVEWPVQPQ